MSVWCFSWGLWPVRFEVLRFEPSSRCFSFCLWFGTEGVCWTRAASLALMWVPLRGVVSVVLRFRCASAIADAPWGASRTFLMSIYQFVVDAS
jgi:hypothetical protein